MSDSAVCQIFSVPTYSSLEAGNLLVGKCIRLGNHGNQVDLGMEAAHNLNVKGLEGVASGLNEEDTGVNSVVDNIHSVDLVLGIEVSIKTLFNVVGDWAPRLVVVDKVTKAGSINNSQAEADTGFFDIGADRLNGNSLGNDVEARSLALLGGVKGSIEEGVDKGRLAQPGFTYTVVRATQQQDSSSTYRQP